MKALSMSFPNVKRDCLPCLIKPYMFHLSCIQCLFFMDTFIDVYIFPFDLYTWQDLLSGNKSVKTILSLISNDVILTSHYQILDKHVIIIYLICLKWTSHCISHLKLCLLWNIAMRNPFSQNKSTILYIFSLRKWDNMSDLLSR